MTKRKQLDQPRTLDDPWAGVVSERALLYQHAPHDPKGAEPWEWRPPRPMRQPDGKIAIDQPPPPTAVRGARPREASARGYASEPERREAARAIEASSLSPHEREVYRRRHSLGQSRAEIAQLLGLSETAVKRALERAAVKIRGVVERWSIDDDA